MRPLRSALLVAALVTSAPSSVTAQRYPACGTWEGSWSLDDAAADFYAAAAQDAETAAALSYQAAAEAGASASRADLYREAARASERAIADLVDAARLLEASGQLRLARGVRNLKARHRTRADANWERLERLGGTRDADPDRRTLACDDPGASAFSPGTEALRHRADELLVEADDLLAGVVEVTERAGLPAAERRLEIQALDGQIGARLVAGADALLAAGCLAGSDGLEDLLEASYCYDAAYLLTAEQVPHEGEIQVRRAAILRAIAHRLAESHGAPR